MVNAVTPADIPSPQSATSDSRLFSATLLPHRSLSRKGFFVLMALIGLVCFISGLAFAMIGAWPVFGFFGLDILLVYIAFRMNYRAARMFESIDLSEDELRVTRVHPSGRSESWSFNPYWVRFELRKFENAADEMSLTSHGRKLIFGAFLSDVEKRDFAAAFSDALTTQRTAPALR